MWLTILIPILLNLLEWLFSKDGPFNRREEKQLRRFVQLARKVETRAMSRGLVIPDEEVE